MIGAGLRVEVRRREITMLFNNSNPVYRQGCVLRVEFNKET